MKINIHPQYNTNVPVACACGESFLTGSTEKEIKVEICSACHPFFTGKQKLVDTAGRVDRFRARVAAKLASDQNIKARDEEKKVKEAKNNPDIKSENKNEDKKDKSAEK